MKRTSWVAFMLAAFVIVGALSYFSRGTVVKPFILAVEAVDWAMHGPQGETFPSAVTFPDGETVSWYSDDYLPPFVRCLSVTLTVTGCDTYYHEGRPRTECGERIDNACHWIYPEIEGAR